MKKIKPYLRWFILGGTLFFVLKAFKEHWKEVTAVRIEPEGWVMLVVALLITLLAHIWSGWVWSWILYALEQPVGKLWAMRVYLRTNIAKYLPGNIWHFYGRISAVSKVGGSLGAATLSVFLEPLLMAAAALIIALISSSLGLIKTASNNYIFGLQILFLLKVLMGIHPRVLNPVIHFFSRSKADTEEAKNINLNSYPVFPLLGEIGFLILRGTGFLFTFMALLSVGGDRIPRLLSAFSFAWLLGLVVPGAPGGMGVFEATAIALLDGSDFPEGIILSSVALFRLISILAEAIAAVLASIR